MSDGDNDKTVKDVKNTILELRKKSDVLTDEDNVKNAEIEIITSQNSEIKGEVDNLLKRIESLETECTDSQAMLELTQNNIEHVTKIADDNERWRKEFETKQFDNDERIEEMNSLIKAANQSTGATSAKYDEAHERLLKTTEGIRIISGRIDVAKKRIDEKEKEMKVKLTAYKKLQSDSEQRIEKETKREVHLHQLRLQVEEAELRAQKAEDELSQKQADINRLKNRLKSENDTVGHLRKDMTKMSSEFKKL